MRWMVFGLVLSHLASTAPAQSDPAFNAQVDNPIYAMTALPDGRTMLGGQFTSFAGVPRNYLARLNADGLLDNAFNPGANNNVYAWVVLTNGQVLAGGSFTNLAGQPRSHLGRLNPDGTLDATFNVSADGDVYSVLQQADGKIVIAGSFNNLAGQPRNFIGRLNANGTLDSSYDPNAGAAISSLALQADGKILAGGSFQSMGGQPRSYICRLNTNGTLDTAFVASADNQVHAIAVQADGRIIAGGLFIYFNGDMHVGLARLQSDGMLDTNFNATVRPGYLGDSDTIAIQTDGKIIVGGTAVGWFEYPYFARFNSDGTTDTNFTVNIPSGVHSIALQRDGKILYATYSTLDRFTNAPAIESLTYSSPTITWLRSGSSPEVWRTTFESSTNLTNWVYLGAGTRIGGGWRLTGVSAPANARIRARGFIAGGYHNASQSYVEAYAGPVVVAGQPASRTNNADTTATFSVLADGTQPLSYRWRKNGANLADTGNVSGATNSTLTLGNVRHADAASYSVVISNSFGAVTSTVATLTVIDPFIASQPTNQFVDVGQTAQFSITATGTPPLSFRWLKNGTNFPGATTATLVINNAQIADAGSAWQAVVTNAFGASTSSVALLTINGATVDTVNPAPNYPVRSLAIQPDGKILFGGYFSWVGTRLQSGIARLNPDGTVDTNFVAGILGIPFSEALPVVALQEDGKILLAGGISWANGVPRNQIARFNTDGSLDLAFNPGADTDIFAMTIDASGKIVLGGSFTNLGGLACNHIGRLNPDGSPDTNFVSGVNGTVYSLAAQPDGKLLVGGSFTALGATPVARTNIGRLNADGGVDGTFNPGADGLVQSLAIQSNAFIVVGGTFAKLGGQTRVNIGRLTSSGSLDASFNPGVDGPVVSLVLQTDGKIAVGGSFTILGGQPRRNLGRLNANGNTDPSFNPGADGAISSLAVQPDGNLVVAGGFGVLDGQPRANLARLNSTTAAPQGLSHNPTTITWLRGGTGPEVTRVFFDVSTNGTTFLRQAGTRITGGWQASGLSLPANATVRARGWVAGSSDGSAWFSESVIGPALIEKQPLSLTNDPLTMAAFEIIASGQQPLSYHWLRNGVPLNDGSNLSGAFTARLTINSALGADAGAYQCVVSNSFGSVTSIVATLTVRDPMMTADPAGVALNAGQAAQFSASAIGTTPLAYHWERNGVPLEDGGNISGAQTTTLTVNNAFGGDAGSYRAVATNLWGSATSAVAMLTVVDPLIIGNPVSQAAQRGQTVTFNASAAGTQPLAWQWRHDGAVLPGASASSLVLTNVQWADAGAYYAIATNSFGSVTSTIATLTVNLAVADALNPGANGFVSSAAVQTDGKILVGGVFTTLGGQTRTRIGRLNADGTLDAAFNPGASNNVSCIGMQTNGAIVLAGVFTTVAGQPRGYLARLNADGSLDGTLNVPANSFLSSLAIQTDGRILVGGYFSTLGGQPRNYIGRLNADGSLDGAFNPGADGFVTSLALQTDGKILVGGTFTTLAGESCTNLGRLHPDGSFDAGFNAGADGSIRSLAEQADGRILVGGDFSMLSGQPRSRLGRLNSDGTVDVDFNIGAAHALGIQTISCLAIQADGRIIVGGNFDHLGGVPRSGLARINLNGTLDPTFTPSTGSAYTLAVQKDGNIVVGGYFGSLAGQARNNLGRLTNTDLASESIVFDSSTITWSRGGTAPEVRDAAFEFSTNGLAWEAAGAGTRIPNGWQLTGLSLPPGSAVRARGFVAGGNWFVETIAGTAVFASPPASRTNNAGTTATFSVAAIGGLPLAYQWLKNGVVLGDGGNVAGTQTSVLTLTNVFGADAGQYQVVASNSYGSVTSRVATLTVVDPFITSQPANVTTNAGNPVRFSVGTLATSPLSFQWRKTGADLAGATASSLTLPNVQRADAAGYDVIVSNAFGVVTSSVATLFLNLATPDSLNPGANGQVSVLLPQTDGRILVGGSFSLLAGQSRSGLGRLYPDGSLDPSFIPNGLNNASCLAILPDGRILAGALSGQRVSVLFVLGPNGVVDTNLTLGGTDGAVAALVPQADGKILAGGNFTSLDKKSHPALARLNANLTVDTNFVTSANSAVTCLAAQEDGKVVVGGAFSVIGGTNRSRIARLNPDGTVDPTFDPGANNLVNSIAIQADGKILVAGLFTTIGGTNRSRIARLNPDGTPDLTFDPGVNNSVYSIGIQTDGAIVLGGTFTTIGGITRNRIARLDTEGIVDPWFNPGASGTVFSIAVQPDGAILAGGSFASMASTPRTNLARLTNPDPATQTLSSDGSTATWLRTGSGPEFWRASFDVSINGSNWTSLGSASRIAGGWQLSGLSLPLNANLRGRGLAVSGVQNGSSWTLESTIGRPVITLQPLTRTNNAGTVASFYSAASGTAPMAAQWFRNGLPLSDGGKVFGANSPSLTLSNVFGADAAGYSVVFSNSFGSVTSLVAILKVVEPIITAQPINVATNAGQTVQFSVVALGSAPLAYQWGKQGTVLPGATASALILPGTQATDAGGYSVVVTSPFGSITSAVATLSLNLALPDTLNPAPNDQIRALAVRTDGKVLFGGNLGSLGRLNANGLLDLPFNPGANSSVDSVVVQPDGRILVGGWFTTLAGAGRNRLGRLNPDGSIDGAFNPTMTSSTLSPLVNSLALQPDNKILVGGFFTTLDGQARNYIGRLNPDGTLDPLFNPNANNQVIPLALQPDGKVVFGGWFTTVAGQTHTRIARVNSDGTLDATFNPSANADVQSLLVQPNGKILVGGSFTALNGVTRNYLGRLNADGTLDTAFNPNPNGGVVSMALQADGTIIIGAGIGTGASQSRFGLTRLNPNGSLDATFFPVITGGVASLAIQQDGALLLGGLFSSVAGEPRINLARLSATDPATQNLGSDGSTITWLRGGTSPEVSYTTFEISSNGLNWSNLGAGSRIAGGWQLAGLSVPVNSFIRARGFAIGGYWSGSGWFVESLLQVSPLTPPRILSGDPTFGVHSNQFSFNVRAVPGQAVVIEASIDFVAWIPIQTNLVTSLAQFIFADSQSGLFPHRYYRARLFQGTLPPPAIGAAAGALGFQSGQFGFNVSGIVGQTLVIETTSSLSPPAWTAIATNHLNAAPLYFNDPGSTNSTLRFYRARVANE